MRGRATELNCSTKHHCVPVVMVGCQIRETVYQNIKVGLSLVGVGSIIIEPFVWVNLISINFGMFRANEMAVTGMI